MPGLEGRNLDQLLKESIEETLSEAVPSRDLWPEIEAAVLRERSRPCWRRRISDAQDWLVDKAREVPSKLRWLWPTWVGALTKGVTDAVRTMSSVGMPGGGGGAAALRWSGVSVATLTLVALLALTMLLLSSRNQVPLAPEDTLARGLNDYWYESGQSVSFNGGESYGDFFDSEGANPMVATHDNFECKFGVDVNTTPYAMTLQSVMGNALPDTGSVQVEAFVNSFVHDYEPPVDDAFALYVEGAPSPFGEGTWLFNVGLQARTAEEAQVIARNVKAWMAFNPEVVKEYRQLGYEYERVASDDLVTSSMYADEVMAGHTVTALFEVTLIEGATGRAATAHTEFKDPDTGEVMNITRDFDRSEFAAELTQASPQFRRDAAVAEFAEVLRGSYWSTGDLDEVIAMVRQAQSQLPGDTTAVNEFADLVARTKDIM